MNRFKIVIKKACHIFKYTTIVINSEEDLLEFIERFQNDWNKSEGHLGYMDTKGTMHYINTRTDDIIKIKEIK